MPQPTLRIIDRYLVRELLASVVAATAIFLLITIGGTVATLLSMIARGKIPVDLLFSLIGLNTVATLTILVPLAVFIGVQLAYGRLYRESEMAVFAASGLSLSGLLRPLILLAIPLMLIMAMISFWLAPASKRMSNDMTAEANRSLIIPGLDPGRFVGLPGAKNDGVMYVEGMNEDGTHIKKMFFADEKVDPDTKTVQINIITATDGELYHDVNGTERYLRLNDGFRVEGVIGQDNYRLIRYERNDIKLQDADQDSNAGDSASQTRTADLLASNDPVLRTELQWRLAAPISVIVLVLLALPLSKSSPRQPRYASLLIALLAWVIYYIALNITQSQMSQGKFSLTLGFWVVHIPTLVIAIYLIWRSQKLPRAKKKLLRPAIAAGTAR
jgi:lipopolysaccharide export system permease protein